MQATRTAKKATAVAAAAAAAALRVAAVAVALQVKKAFSLQEALVLQAAAQTSNFSKQTFISFFKLNINY